MELINEGVNEYKSPIIKKYSDDQIDELILVGGGIPWKRGDRVKYSGKVSSDDYPQLLHGELHNIWNKTSEGKQKLFFGNNAYEKDFTFFGINYEVSKKYGQIFIDVAFNQSMNALEDKQLYLSSRRKYYYNQVRGDFNNTSEKEIYQLPMFNVFKQGENIEVRCNLRLEDFGSSEDVNSKITILPMLFEKMYKINGITPVDLQKYISEKNSKNPIQIYMYKIVTPFSRTDAILYSKEKAVELSKEILKLERTLFKQKVYKENEIGDAEKGEKIDHTLAEIYKLAEMCKIDVSKLSNDHRGLISIDELGLF